jgi:uncharacterized membrane-anchored protein YhcB (DUF1043 family)
MNAESSLRPRLCPNCANSIDENAEQCPYCKTDLLAGIAPKWLSRSDPSSEPRASADTKKKFPIPAKYIWSVALLGILLIAVMAGGYIQRSELAALSQATSKQLQTKDQIIKSQQDQLENVQKQLSENTSQLAEIKIKLEDTQKQLAAKQQHLAAATREAKIVNTTRSAAVNRTATRGAEPSQSYPQPASVRRSAQPGVYETTKATAVHEAPSATSRAISQIGRGTRINVVSATGDWLEVRSKHGNPPGYVRSDDTRLLGRPN